MKRLLIFSLFILFIASCKNKPKPIENSAELMNYISAYSTGEVSKNSSLMIQFTQDAIKPSMIGQELDQSSFEFEPKIEGKSVWVDTRTVKFTPNEELKSKQAFVGNFKIGKFFKDLSKDAQLFAFDFRIKEQHITNSIEPIFIPDPQLNSATISGSFTTNDYTELEKIKKCLKVKYKSRELRVDWINDQPNIKSKYFKYSIAGIELPAKNETLLLQIDGRPVDANNQEAIELVIPSDKGFVFVDKVVQNLPDQVIKLHFNKPIDTKQDLAGFISFSNNASIPRLDVESNVIFVYPEERLIGKYTITINKALKNIRGEQLAEDQAIEINFEDVKPGIRIENNNMILPDVQKLYLPFEAVNLNAIDVEIFKIYNNNVLQYLQTEGGDDYNLNRVGKIVMQKKIILNEGTSSGNLQKWKKYSIDLANIIKPEPNALYQVRIGFKSQYSTYGCAEDMNTEKVNPNNDSDGSYFGMGEEFDDGEFKSIMNNYYGYEGYYDDYDWSDRDDPCKPAYYNSSRFKSCMLLSSNIGIIAKAGNGGDVMVITTDLNSTEALSGVDLQFYDFQLQQLQTTKTNSDGIGLATFKKKPFAVIATLNGRKSYLRLWDNESLNISQFDVVGEDVQKGMKGFLYGERGVWRPGDSLYLNFMLDAKGKNDLPSNLPISFEFYDPKGVLQYSTTTSKNINKLYPLYTSTRQDALTGNWKAVIKAGGASFIYPIKIETIKPNKMKLKLDFGKKELSHLDEPVSGILSASWLYGAPAKNLKAKIDLSMWQLKDKFPKFPNYKIYDERKSPNYSPEVWFEGQLNEEGVAKINKQLLSTGSNASGPMIANFKIRVFEQGGESSQDNFGIKYHPFNQYCGVAVPADVYGHTTFGINQNIPISVASISKDGNPIPSKSLSVEVFKVEWRWWWDEEQSYYRNYEQSDAENLAQSNQITTNAAGKAVINFKTSEWGRYFVRVTDKTSGHVSGDYFYCGYPESDDMYLARRAASIIAVMSNKEEYSVGEKIKLKINCPEKGKVLISLENGSKVVKTIWKEAVKGENEFTFEATADLAPSVYANVSIIQGFGQNVNDLPVRMYGIIPLKVEDKSTRLKPVITMVNELKPGVKSNITISETSGRAMAYTIDIVDEGLLDITRFATPDPWQKFFAREALGVKTWDLFDKLIGTYSQEGSQILSIGGDAGKTPNPDKQKAIRFKPMVIHLGPFYLEKGKQAKHNFTVPNYIGSVRTMVVASDNGAYGSSEKTIPVRSPLMVLASFPRVVGPGETIKVPINVFTTDIKVKNVSVSIEDQSGIIRTASKGIQNLSFSKPDEKIVYFDLIAGNAEGISKIRINASGNGEKSYQEIEVDVRNSNPVQTSVISGLIKAKSNSLFKIDPVGIKGTNKTILEVSTLPPINLQKHLNYLITYPHGCLEQTVSAAFPQLFLSNVVKLTEKQKVNAERNVKAAISKLKNFITAEGGFNYWPGGSVNHWANNYAGHFLIEAKSAGYNVPQNMFDNWLKFEKKLAKNWSPTQKELGYYEWESSSIQAYRLYLLALAGTADKGAMNRMRELSELDRESAVLLAAAYAIDGKTAIATQMLNGKKSKTQKYEYSGNTFGSDLRDKSILIETLDLIGRKNESAALFVNICSELGKENSFYSTQTLAFSLRAVARYLGSQQQLGKGLKFTYSVDGKSEISVNVKEPMMLIELPLSQVASTNLKVNNLEGSLIYVRIAKSGKPAAGKEKEESSNLNMAMNFTDLKGNKVDPSKMKRGDDFLVEMTVSNPGIFNWTYTNMALTQVFPPGWEITNTRMNNVNFGFSSGNITYQDFRDDRVLSYFNLSASKSISVKIQLTASYPGKYYLPGMQCEAMYDNFVYARKKGTWVTVL